MWTVGSCEGIWCLLVLIILYGNTAFMHLSVLTNVVKTKFLTCKKDKWSLLKSIFTVYTVCDHRYCVPCSCYHLIIVVVRIVLHWQMVAYYPMTTHETFELTLWFVLTKEAAIVVFTQE